MPITFKEELPRLNKISLTVKHSGAERGREDDISKIGVLPHLLLLMENTSTVMVVLELLACSASVTARTTLQGTCLAQ